jgi:hypothetical protein
VALVSDPAWEETAGESASELMMGAVLSDEVLSREVVEGCSGTVFIAEASVRCGMSELRSVCSFIVFAIFSNVEELICFSRPLPRISFGSCIGSVDCFISTGSDRGRWCASILSQSAEATESTLSDSPGTSSSSRAVRDGATSMADDIPQCSSRAQQNVSRHQSLQLKFSNRRPSSRKFADFENTFHMLKSSDAFFVSTWANLFVLNDNSGIANRGGISLDVSSIFSSGKTR